MRTGLFSFVFAAVIGAVATHSAAGASGDIFVSVNGSGGNAGGFIYKYTPSGEQSIFASDLSRPRGLAFDSGGNLVVAINFRTNTFQCTLLKIAPDGTQNVFATVANSFFCEGVAIDNSDNVFVMGIAAKIVPSMIFRFGPDGKPSGSFGIVPGEGFGLAFDSIGDLFAADHTSGTIYKFTAAGKRSVFADKSAFPGFAGPIGLAVDGSDNLFVSTTGTFPVVASENAIFKFTQEGTETTFATGMNFPQGLAFDANGSLFATENPFVSGGDILKFEPDGSSTLFASGIGGSQGGSGPTFVAIQP
jgi:sugar lactone lactonase YvrE